MSHLEDYLIFHSNCAIIEHFHMKISVAFESICSCYNALEE